MYFKTTEYNFKRETNINKNKNLKSTILFVDIRTTGILGDVNVS